MPKAGGEATRVGEVETLTSTAGLSTAAPAAVTVLGLTVLFHPDMSRIGERVALRGLARRQDEAVSRLAPDFAAPASALARPLADPYLSRQPILLRRGRQPGSVRLVAAGSPTSVTRDGVPIGDEAELTAAELTRGVVLVLAKRVVLLLAEIDPLAGDAGTELGLIGASPPMVQLALEVRRAARLAVPVLLRGETGTGKELVAEALHRASERRDRPYVAVNMAAVPPSLAAAELFGATRGSFTGADRERAGFFGRARGGTLFLDEIGETPPEVQPLLLRALESGEIQPVGGGAPLAVDVRLVAATDTDLDAAIAAGRFRAPLLHRLAGYEIRLPPLRDRREDIGRLLVEFLRQELTLLGHPERLELPRPDSPSWLPASLVAQLVSYSWPGNVRELRNLARKLAVAGAEATQLPPDLPWTEWLAESSGQRLAAAPPTETAAGADPADDAGAPRYRSPEEVSEEEMIAALRTHRFRIQPTAAALGLSRTSLYAKIEASTRVRKASDLSRTEIAASLASSAGELAKAATALEVSKRGLLLRMHQLGMSLKR